MKKHVSIIALTALVVAFVTFSGVASAQPTNVEITLFTQPMCAVCQQVDPIVHSVAAANPSATLVVHDTSTAEGKGVAQANNVMSTPTIIITKNGQQTFRSDGKLVSAPELQAALGSILSPKVLQPHPSVQALPKVQYPPIPVQPVQVPKVQPIKVNVHEAVSTVTKRSTMSTKYPAASTKYPAAVSTVTKRSTMSTKSQTYTQPYTQPQTTQQPPIEVVSTPPTQTQNAPASTVPEFSLLGLGAPALVVGAIYLFMRRM